jgi:hypothetical protein
LSSVFCPTAWGATILCDASSAPFVSIFFFFSLSHALGHRFHPFAVFLSLFSHPLFAQSDIRAHTHTHKYAKITASLSPTKRKLLLLLKEKKKEMSAAVEVQYPAEDSYAEDEFEDDFESEDTSSAETTPRGAAHADKHSANSSSANTSASSSKRSSAAAPAGQYSSGSSDAVAAPVQHSEKIVPHCASASSALSHSTHTTTTTSSSSSSSSSSYPSESRKSSFSSNSRSHVSSHHADNDDAELEESGGHQSTGSKKKAESEDSTVDPHTAADAAAVGISADGLRGNVERRADGSSSERCSRSDPKDAGAAGHGKWGGGGGRAAVSGRRGDREGNSGKNSTAAASASAERHRVQRPDVPQNAEELEALQAENAKLRDQLFEKNREHYHASLARTGRGKQGMSSVAGTTTGMTSTTGGAAGLSGGHRDAAARRVQESLMAHRTLQSLRLEQRDLTQRRDELKKLISKYKRASKYRELVEAVKQDIADYQEEHRDVQLEVRCNEKLLLLAEHMVESGVGDRRVQEEIRAQNALTQRRREHALRDADAAQRKRDTAAQRVEELKAELDRRREAAGKNGSKGLSSNLLAVNRAKKDRIRELRAQLQEAESSGQEHTSSSHPRYRSQQSVRDDAEREYLQGRIAEMQRELDAAASCANNESENNQCRNPTSPSAAADSRTSANTSTSHIGKGEAAHRSSGVSPPSPSSSHGSRKATSPSQTGAEEGEASTTPSPADPAAAAAPPETEEIDVTAWLNAHPVAATATDPAETLRPTTTITMAHAQMNLGVGADQHHGSQSSNEHHSTYPTNDTTTAAQPVYIPPVPKPPYAQEAAAAEPIPALLVPAVSHDTPPWLGGGGMDEDSAPAETGPAPLVKSLHSAEESEDEHFEEEEVVDDEDDEAGRCDELDEHQPNPSVATAPEASTKEDDGPAWLNF